MTAQQTTQEQKQKSAKQIRFEKEAAALRKNIARRKKQRLEAEELKRAKENNNG